MFSLDSVGQQYEFPFKKSVFSSCNDWEASGSRQQVEVETEVTGDFFDACLCCGWFSCYLPLPSMTLLSSALPSWKLMWPWNIFVPFLFWFDVMWCLWRIRGNSNSSFILHFLSSELDKCFLPRKDKIPEPLLLLNSILLSLLSSEPPHNYYSLHETLPLDFLFFYLFLWIRGWNVSWKIIL